jgi:hypothetical protein
VHMDCGQRGFAHRLASAFCPEFCQTSCHEPPRRFQAQFFSTQPDYRSKVLRSNILSPNVLWSHDLFGKPVSPFRIML